VEGVQAKDISGTFGGLLGYGFDLSFPQTSVRIFARDTNGLLSTTTGYAPNSVSDPVPDAVSPYTAGVIDLGGNADITSSEGFLERLTVETLAAPAAGVFPMALSNTLYLDVGKRLFAAPLSTAVSP
jgi:hypothetical protein